jgi:hypothetical protein
MLFDLLQWLHFGVPLQMTNGLTSCAQLHLAILHIYLTNSVLDGSKLIRKNQALTNTEERSYILPRLFSNDFIYCIVLL